MLVHEKQWEYTLTDHKWITSLWLCFHSAIDGEIHHIAATYTFAISLTEFPPYEIPTTENLTTFEFGFLVFVLIATFSSDRMLGHVGSSHACLDWSCVPAGSD